MRRIELLAIALICCAVTGCSSTTQQTARQLEAGDFVFSGGIDEPGFLYVPRLHGQVMYGLGPGDLSVHVGTSLVTFNAGLGSRFYLGERWNAGLQLDFNGIFSGSSDDLADFSGLYSGTLRLTTSARKQAALYGGFHLGTHTASDDERDFQPPVFLAGGVIGLDLLVADNFGLQIEARLSPFLLDTRKGVGVFPITERAFEDSPASLFVGQLGISLYKRWSATPSIQGSVAEERWNDPDNDFVPRPATPRPRDSPPSKAPSDPLLSPSQDGSAPTPPPPDRK